MKCMLEVIIIPVSDIDRAVTFYRDALGFPIDFDVTISETQRFVQFTPEGSGCSIQVNKGMGPTGEPGSLRGLILVVSDVAAAREELVGRGVDVSEIEVIDPRDGGTFIHFSDPDGNTWTVQQIQARAGLSWQLNPIP